MVKCDWTYCGEPATKQVLLRRKESGAPVRRWALSDPYCDEHADRYKDSGAYIYQDVPL